jgi:2-desacetyl-2-hydroxyethyl bacteriochlorophyllide A dehydrogenase
MRAWHIVQPIGPAGLSLVEVPDPVPGPADVVVRPRAVSLNYRDLLVVGGRYGRPPAAGAVPCSDAAGEVVQVGAAVADVRVGDRVTSTFAPGWLHGQYSVAAAKTALGSGETPGVLAEAIVLPAHGVMPINDGLSWEAASTLPCAALTAWHALFEEAPFRADCTVLTLGTGGVSIFALQFATHAGARVFATSSSDAKRERLARLGAAATLNYRDDAAWGDTVRRMAGHDGVDQVIEVGGQGTLAQSLRAVRPGGTITLIGTLAEPSAVQLTPVFMKNVRLQGIMVGSREMYARMNASLAATGLQPVIDRVFPFEDAPAAFEYMASGAHFGKVVIRCG